MPASLLEEHAPNVVQQVVLVGPRVDDLVGFRHVQPPSCYPPQSKAYRLEYRLSFFWDVARGRQGYEGQPTAALTSGAEKPEYLFVA